MNDGTPKKAPSRAAVLKQMLAWFEQNNVSGTPIVPLWLGEVDGVPVDSLMAADALRGNQEILPVWEQNAAGAKVVVTMDSGAVTHAFSNLPGIEVVVHDSDTLERDGFNQVRRKDILDKSTVACEPIVFMDSFSAVKGLA